MTDGHWAVESQDRRCFFGVERHHGVTHEVDAAVNGSQAAVLDAPRDLVGRDAPRDQLPPSNATVLPVCEGTNYGVHQPGREKCWHIQHNPRLTEDAPYGTEPDPISDSRIERFAPWRLARRLRTRRFADQWPQTGHWSLPALCIHLTATTAWTFQESLCGSSPFDIGACCHVDLRNWKAPW